jgi:hypothetical protein
VCWQQLNFVCLVPSDVTSEYFFFMQLCITVTFIYEQLFL